MTKFIIRDSAEKIIQRISNIIPYPVSITDEDGCVIAASGHQEIGVLKDTAIRAIRQEEANIVYRDTRDCQKGICFPLWYKNTIAGSIEINGDLDEIMRIGQMTASLTELMIENQGYHATLSKQLSRVDNFYFDWIHTNKENYDQSFLDQAKYFKIDLNISRVAVIIKMRRIRYSVIDKITALLRNDEYIVRQSLMEFTILLCSKNNIEDRLSEIMSISDDFIGCYTGAASTDASQTVWSAEQVKKIGESILPEERIVHFSSVETECAILSIAPSEWEKDLIQKIKGNNENGSFMKSTIMAYARYGDDPTKTCEKLCIHRNTLNYRLDRIEHITGKNPRRGNDLFLLYTAVVHMMASVM